MNKLLSSCFIFIRSLGWISTLSALFGIAESLAAPQSIDWTSPTNGSVLRLGQEYPLNATASSGLPVMFRIERGPGVVSGSTVTVTNIGTVVLVATQIGDASHDAVTVTRIVNQSAIQATLVGSSNPGKDPISLYPIDVKVVGSKAYMATVDTLRVFNLTDSVTPVFLGACETRVTPYELQVSGNRAYVAGSGGLRIVDISNPSIPTPIGDYPGGGNITGVQVSGKVACLTDAFSGLVILDVSNPTNPSQIGLYSVEQIQQARVIGNTAYVAARQSGLHILDVGDPSFPVRLGGFTYGGVVGGVEMDGHLAHLATDQGRLIVDVSNPKHPFQAGQYFAAGVLRLAGDLAYATAGAGGLQVIDLTTPSAPVELRVVGTTDGVSSLQIAGDLAYLGIPGVGLQVFELRELIDQSLTWLTPTNGTVVVPNQALPLSATASSGLPVSFRVLNGPASVNGDALTATNVGTIIVEAAQSGDSVFLPVREVRTVNQIAVKATLAGGRDTHSAQAVQVVDNMAYVADSDAGLQIIDVRDPANLSQVGGFDTAGKAWDVQVEGNLAYIADGAAGLQLIDVGDPAKPVRIAGFDTEGFSTGVCVAGDLALVADGDAGLQIFDAKTLFRLGGIDTVGRCWKVKVSGTLAYLADDTGLQIVDIRNPAEPVALGRYNSPGANSLGVDVAGGFAYLAGQSLFVVDVSDPVAPRLVAQYGGGGVKVETTGNLVYVATVYDGFQIIDITAPDRPQLVGKLDTDGYAVDVRVVGDRAYVADSGAGLKVVRLDQVIPQTMSFTPPISANPADSPIVLQATASSGLPVTFSVVSGPAKVVGNLLVLTGEGNVVVRAEQTGEGVIAPIAAEKSVLVAKISQSITWETPANRSVLVLNEARPLLATASSGLPVSFRVAHGPAVVSAGTVTATNVGTIVVTAEQAGDDRNRPVSVARTFNQSATPEWLGSHDTLGFAGGLQVEGSLAYVADGSAGLQIVDVANPAAPVRLGSYNTSGLASWVQVVGNIAYVADGSAGLHILDVGNPATPIRLGSFDTSGSAHYVQVVGNLAYVADGGPAYKSST